MGIHERKEREREQRRHDILVSARKAFSKHGLDHCTMERIAEEAELSKGTLYLYYRNRDELLLGLVTDDLEGIVLRLERVATLGIAPDKKLLRAVSTFQKFSESHQLFYRAITMLDMRVILDCKGECEYEPTAKFQAMNTRMMDALITMVQEGIDTGMFHTEQSVRYVVFQMLVALKGIMIVLHNNLFSPSWGNVDNARLLHDTAELMIRGLKCQTPHQGQYS